MGRTSKPDQPETPNYQANNSIPAPTSYQYGNETAQASSRVVTDSESIARDIKEGRLSGFVGHGTVLTGETNFQMMLRVDGHLTGTVMSDGGTLIVGNNGQVDANVMVAIATVNGAVNCDIVASEKIQLGRTARVIGNVSTPKLVIEDGAVFEGGCTMLKAREDQDKKDSETRKSYKADEPVAEESNPAASEYSDEYLTSADDDNEVE
ncbi:MAG: bactofilin family protein [Pyrinomonadaceae bacterium]